MRSESSSVSSFHGFLSSVGIGWRVGAVLLVGILLLFVGNLDFGEEKELREEDRIAEMCAMTEGVGECRAVVTYSADGKSVYAVALLCEGAENVEVRKRLTETVSSLYGIGSHRVSVIRLSK